MEEKSKKGFTLVEILAVIVLISLIVIIAVPSVKSISAKSKRKLFDTKVKIAEDAVNLWAENNKSCFEADDGCNVFSNCYLESNIYTCETTFGTLAEQEIINYDEEYNGDGYVVNPIDSGSMNDFKLIVTLDNNNKMVNTDFDDDDSIEYVPIDKDKTTKPTSGTVNENDSTSIAQAIYSADDKSLTFIRNILYNVGDTYNGKTVSAVYTGFEDDNTSYKSWLSISTNIEKVYVEDVIKPISTAFWFSDFKNCSYFDLTNLDSSFVKNMNSMFSHAGYNAETFKIVGLDNWDTSNVTDMHGLFNCSGYSATEWDIGDLSNWDTSNVTDMSMLFSSAGYNSKTFKIVGLDNWDTSNVTKMNAMFQYAGYSAAEWDIGNLQNWDTTDVTDLTYMFLRAGYNSKTFKIVGLDNWDTSNVTEMYGMFHDTGYNATTWDIGNLRTWDTSKVTNMGYMFYNAGYNASYRLNLSNWNVRNVTKYNNFNSSVSSKVIAPSFVTSA